MIIHDDMPRRDHPLMVDFMQWRRSTMDHGPWSAFSAAHAKYAPRWLPIGEAANTVGRILCGQLLNHSVIVLGLARRDSVDVAWEIYPQEYLRETTHYMPIPDAQEVG